MELDKELLQNAILDLNEVIEWINAERQNDDNVPMRDEDWNWLLARIKSARTIMHNELKRKNKSMR